MHWASILSSYIPENGVSYKVPNSSYVPMEKVLELLAKDLKKEEDAVNLFLEKNHISLNFHQFDALVSFTHQYGVGWWSYRGDEEKQLPKFIRMKKGDYDPKEVEHVYNWQVQAFLCQKKYSLFLAGWIARGLNNIKAGVV